MTEKRSGHPFWDFVKAASVVTVLMVVIHVPIFSVMVGAVLTALLIAGVWE